MHRPAANRFDAAAAELRHSGTWAAGTPCARCYAEGAAVPPKVSGTVGYDIGATPFYGEATVSVDYFAGRRYQLFEASLPQLAANHGITLLDVRRVQGVWQGQPEPSALISVDGNADSVLALMVELADRWGQEGVICFSAEVDGDASLHIGSTHLTAEEVCARQDADGLSGITVDAEGAVMILDLKGDQPERAHTTLTQLGAPEANIEGYGFLHLRVTSTHPRAKELPAG